MHAANLFRLLLLSAIWGASFLFMRVAVPVLGPFLLIGTRVALAAVFLWGVAAYMKKPLKVVAHAPHYLTLGVLNSALPFVLFAYAAQTLSASLLSILNATAPIWAAAMGALLNRASLSGKAGLGMLLGVLGVGLLVGIETMSMPSGGALAVVAGLAAACSYGAATTYTHAAQAVDPFANAHGSMWAATLVLLPGMLYAPAWPTNPSLPVMGAVLALGVMCSGIAYLLYFRLIVEIGAAQALSVTFLIPVFGVLWGWLFLGEPIGWHTLVGGMMILLGTAFATGFSPASIRLGSAHDIA